MHYFIHGPNIAAVEDAEQAAKCRAAGWIEVSRAAFIAAWRKRDEQARPEPPAEPQEKVVGEVSPPKGFQGYEG